MHHLAQRLLCAAPFLCFSLGACREQVSQRRPPPSSSATHSAPGSTAAPARLPAQRLEGLTFARIDNRTLELDLYLPERAAADDPLPVVVWFHGGGWVSGSRRDCPARFLLDHGFAVASASYRMSFEATFPAQIHDGKAAVRFLRARAATYGLDGDRIGVFGQSAGGHMAALLATSGGVVDLEGPHGPPDVSSAVQACCNFCGIIDLATVDRPDGVQGLAGTTSPDSVESRLVGGPVLTRLDACRTANPLTYLDAQDPPCLTMHGEADQLVPIRQSMHFHESLQRAGVPSTLSTVPGGGHVFGGPEVEAQVAAFFRTTLARRGKP